MVDAYYIDTLVDAVVDDLRAPEMPEKRVREVAREAVKCWADAIATQAVIHAILNEGDVVRRVIRNRVKGVLQ